MDIALLPLDERPVNTSLPIDIGRIVGARVLVPPAELLPRQRVAGKPDALVAWLAARAGKPELAGAIACLDMAVYGGLIAARTSADSLPAALARLEALASIRTAHPDLALDAVSLVMRASDSYDPGEEPDYWAFHGRELHRLGGALHRAFLGEEGARILGDAERDGDEHELDFFARTVPDAVRRDFERRRLRNHQINLAALDLLSRGTLDTLLVTADDTAARSAGSLEQLWLAHWARALPHEGAFLMYPGADEVGAVLVARALARRLDTPVRYRIACATAGGLERIASYENRPVGLSAAGQVHASGGVVVAHGRDEGEQGEDVVLIVHAPDPTWHDWAGFPPDPDDAAHLDAAAATAALVETELARGRAVALADVRYGNGGDPLLVDRLADAGALMELAAYGGWNTAGNTIGSVVAAASARAVGAALGTLDARVARRVLLHRVLEDRSYQAGIRPVIEMERGQNGGAIMASQAEREALATRVAEHLGREAERYAPGEGWRVDAVRFPWHRTFEIDLELASTP